LHAAFARATGDPAFEPVPMVAADIAAWSERAREEAGSVLDRLQQRIAGLPESVRADAERLLAVRDRLLARIAGHASDPPRGTRTRLHGDYHLGQVMLVQNDWVITDFEGEPGRPIEERRQKHSSLKDVAGMLRSVDYAMHAALIAFVAKRPDAREVVERAGRRWRTEAIAALLAGYDEVAGSCGLPRAGEAANGLLELFALEKVVYELRYEVDNRPDWMRIPLAGLLDVLQPGT
jgi:maltose alpha-D-glucosyltransferase/alpha-amylase